MAFRELTIEDMKGIENARSRWDILNAVTRQAQQMEESKESKTRIFSKDAGKLSGAADMAAGLNPKPKKREVDTVPQLPENFKNVILKIAGGISTSLMSRISGSFLSEEEKEYSICRRDDGNCSSAAAMIKPKELSNTPTSKRRAFDKGNCSGVASENAAAAAAAAMIKPKELMSITPTSKRWAVDNGNCSYAASMIKPKELSNTPTSKRRKGLFETDLSEGHNRISIPVSKISENFLSEEEKEFLCRRDESKKMNFKEVKIIEPSLEWEKARLSRWDMAKGKGKTCSTYVIKGTWRYIVDRNRLRVGDVVQLWAFRIEDELCFALVKLPDQNPRQACCFIF
ncbi:hypothetical protein CDL12_20251 [Handroanthus impetiginosus]|uniref:TF-B3 domain-containing protein n=1 Tax=Handroanthus impetiginosus TaxID=429701 RepID=A0A2G9GPK6_9LAMI|nr:hypothetical protein CDL12_20251 [Handroanthus impetiginosus]